MTEDTTVLMRIRKQEKKFIDGHSLNFNLNIPNTMKVMVQSMPKIIDIQEFQIPKSRKKLVRVKYQMEFEK